MTQAGVVTRTWTKHNPNAVSHGGYWKACVWLGVWLVCGLLPVDDLLVDTLYKGTDDLYVEGLERNLLIKWNILYIFLCFEMPCINVSLFTYMNVLSVFVLSCNTHPSRCNISIKTNLQRKGLASRRLQAIRDQCLYFHSCLWVFGSQAQGNGA